MSRCIILGLIFLLTAPVLAQPNLPPSVPKVALPVQEKVDLSSPLLAIRSMAAALNRNDFAQAAQCVDGGKPEFVEKMAGMTDEWKKMHGQIWLSEPRIRVRGDWATATLASKIAAQASQNAPDEQSAQTERVVLRRIDGQWKVVGNTAISTPEDNGAAPVQASEAERGNGFFTYLATFFANPQIMEKANGDAQRAACQSSLKQLALAAMQMVQDYDEVFAFDKAALKMALGANQKTLLDQPWQQALFPYCKKLQIFFCPLREVKPANPDAQARHDKMTDELGVPRSGEPYSLSQRLDGLKLADIAEPARTVLFYEGADEKLDFRHEGMSNVAFCDGHVKAISPNEAGKLIWNPKGK